jgi:hypothetical protein
MDAERWAAVKRAATEMVDEIEWADFPLETDTGRELYTEMVRDPDVLFVVREALPHMLAQIEQKGLTEITGHQEVDLEAGGILLSIIKRVMCLIVEGKGAPPGTPVNAVIAAAFRRMQLRVKFRRLPMGSMQAPPTVWVPSMRDQLAGRQPFMATAAGTSTVQ